MKKLFALTSLVILASLVLAACAPAATPVPEVPVATEAPVVEVPMWEAPAGALVASLIEAAPALDGVADEAFWAEATEIVVPVAGGFGDYSTDVSIKAVYTADSVYFLISYADSDESFFRSPWQKKEDGSWGKVKDANDKGGDNNTVYEDKMSLIWPINNSIPNFETAGCFVACHAGENSDVKPYGNKYTANEGEIADMWHWKSIRNLGQLDDQYLDATRYSAEAAGAGRKSDAKESGGYADNYASMVDPADAAKTVADKTKPGFASPAVDMVTGAPGFILDSEKVALDQAALDAMPVGSYLPGIVKSAFVGDRGDLSAGWTYADGKWTIEIGRKLDTGSATDVQYTDLTASYYFGVAVFNNAQVRHAFQSGVSMLVFKPAK